MTTLFAGHLASGATESIVRELFERFGEVAQVHVVMNASTGISRGFAFVEMRHFQQGCLAIAGLDGTCQFGRNITVRHARPKLEQSQPAGVPPVHK